MLNLSSYQHQALQMKGRVACEVNTADELLVTELIFNGVFNDLDAAQSVCLDCHKLCLLE